MRIIKNLFCYLILFCAVCMVGCSKSSSTISNVSPKKGTVNGNTKITITGTNFVQGSKIKLGKNSATEVKVVSPTQITAMTPNCPDGACFRDVVVVSPTNVEVSLKEGFAYVSTMEIFVTNRETNTVTVFGSDGSGNIEPSRILGGDKTEIRSPSGVFIDEVSRELFVTSNDKILVFRTGDTDTKPMRTISGKSTLLESPSGVFVDTVNNEIFNLNHISSGANITVFPKLESGDAPPKRIVSGGKSVSLPEDVFVDVRNDEVFVTVRQSNSIMVFEREAKGSSAPKRILTGLRTRLDAPSGMSVDTLRKEIYIANSGNDSILVFDKNAKDDVEPKRIIQGSNTKLRKPTGVFVNSVDNEIFVVNSENNSVTVYKREESGNVEPKRTISGDRTKLSSPARIFVSGLPLELIHKPKLDKKPVAKVQSATDNTISTPTEERSHPNYCSVCRGLVYTANADENATCATCEEENLMFCPSCGVAKKDHACEGK